MTAPHITFHLSSRAVVDPWWVRLAQEDLPDDTATVSAAADLLDTLYNLDACDDSTGTPEQTEDVSAEEVTTTVEATVSAVSCLFDADGNVDVVVRVIRSRQDADYRLALVGGVIKTTETVRETVTQQTTLDSASSLTLDYPVIDDFTVQWRGQVYGSSGPIDDPKISRVGNTLDFGGVSVKSGTIRAEYLTEYDRCTITILGKNGEPGECVARAFFHGLVDELELQTPDAAEDIGSCTSHWVAPVSDDEVTCYRAVTKSYRCQCTDKEVYRETYDEITDCPEYVTRCPGNARDCMHLLESITVPEYVGCTDDAEVTGAPGRIYALSTPEYYRDKCCEDPTGALPQCPERTTSWRGGLPIVGGAAKYYGMYGPKLRIVPVSPPGGICGTWKITQEIRSNNCCDGVEPLAWDGDVSPEVMAPNSAVVIGVTGGGKYPYQWSVLGEGIQFQNGAKKITTTGNQVRLSALPLACGMAEITVTDGCTTVVGYIRSTAGKWVMITDNAVTPAAAKAIIGNIAIEAEVSESSYLGLIGYIGRYKVEQQWSYVGNGTSTSCGQWCSTCVDSAFVPGDGVCVWSLDKSLLEVQGDAAYGPLRGNSLKIGNGSCVGDFIVMSKVLTPCGAGGDCYANPPYHNAYIAHGPRTLDGENTNTTVWEWQC